MTTLSAEESFLIQTVREFIDREVKPSVQEVEHANEYPDKWIEQMKAIGIYGLAVPEAYGGAPVSMPCYAQVTQELARGWMSLAGAMGGHTVVAKLLTLFGTEEPVPETPVLRAGPLECSLDAGNLRHIKIHGVEAIREIMAAKPTPIVMFSAHTIEGARETLDALAAGALGGAAADAGVHLACENRKTPARAGGPAFVLGRARGAACNHSF